MAKVAKITRRGLVLGAIGAPLWAQQQPAMAARNISYPLADIEGDTTPSNLFFVRSHFAKPALSLKTWKLNVEGRVERPVELSMADLLSMAPSKIEALLECAGNAAGGFAVSNGEWEGVPLAHLLGEVRADPAATHVLLEGTDTGVLVSEAQSLPYRRVVPITKCQSPESLLAFKLNGSFLPEDNGFPLRALLPGWYAMDSVKWLRRISVLGPDDPLDFEEHSGMDRLYHRIVPVGADKLGATRLSEILVKSVIASPSAWPRDEVTLPGGKHRVWGFAWAGSAVVRQVELSVDGGKSWMPAEIEGETRPLTWVRWSYEWDAPVGEHSLMSRASDDRGRRQPVERDPVRLDGYELNFCAAVRCKVV